jgi:hypothetical protein
MVTRMPDRQSVRLDQLRTEADYHRQRLDLYRAKLYGGRPVNMERLREFERAADSAAERLQQAQAAARQE